MNAARDKEDVKPDKYTVSDITALMEKLRKESDDEARDAQKVRRQEVKDKFQSKDDGGAASFKALKNEDRRYTMVVGDPDTGKPTNALTVYA